MQKTSPSVRETDWDAEIQKSRMFLKSFAKKHQLHKLKVNPLTGKDKIALAKELFQ